MAEVVSEAHAEPTPREIVHDMSPELRAAFARAEALVLDVTAC